MRRLARLLFFGAVAATVAGLSKVHAAYIADPHYDYTGSSRFGWSLGLILVLYVVGYGVGLPDLPRTRRSAFAASASAALISALGLSMVQLLTGDALLPRFVVFSSALAFIPIGMGANAVARRGSTRAEQRDRVAVVGAATEAAVLATELARDPLRPAVIATHVTPADAVGHGGGGLLQAVEASGATVVVLDREGQADERIVSQAAILHERGLRVRTLTLFYEDWLGKMPVSELERASLFFDIGELHRACYGRAKRVFDVALGTAGLVPLAIAVPFVLIGNLLGNRGPLLYRQDRVGRFDTRFSILKFRTMVSGGDGEQPNEWTTEDDPRITSFGRIMRRAHLDELPQVVNILKGDLSVVGPRPEQPHYVTELEEKLPFYALRHLVRPGLTGWAQVIYGYAGDETDALEKLQYEFFYLRHQGIGLDARIVGRTIRSVLGSQGRGR